MVALERGGGSAAEIEATVKSALAIPFYSHEAPFEVRFECV